MTFVGLISYSSAQSYILSLPLVPVDVLGVHNVWRFIKSGEVIERESHELI
jgi:hypothetical protein